MFRTLPAVLALTAGCLPEIDRVDLERVAAQLQPGTEVIMGRMPLVEAFDRPITRNELELVDAELYVGVHGTNDDWVMLAGGVELDPSDLPEGEWVQVHEFDHWIYACTGPRDRVVRFEQSADLVRIRQETRVVELGPPVTELSIVASFGSWGTVGAIAVLPPDAE